MFISTEAVWKEPPLTIYTGYLGAGHGKKETFCSSLDVSFLSLILLKECFASGVFKVQVKKLGQKSFLICKLLCSEIKSVFKTLLDLMLEWLPFSIWLPFIKKYKSFNFIYKTHWERDKPDYGVFLSREKGKWLFSSTVIKQFNERDGIFMDKKYPRGITKDVYNSIWGRFYHSSFIHSFMQHVPNLHYILSQIVFTFCTGYTIAHLIARGFPYNPGDLVSLLVLFQLNFQDSGGLFGSNIK